MPQLKKYFKHSNIPDIVQAYPLPGANRRSAGGGNSPEAAQEKEARRVFTHFVIGLLNPNPWKRWTPKQVCMHKVAGVLPVCRNGAHVGFRTSEIVCFAGERDRSYTVANRCVRLAFTILVRRSARECIRCQPGLRVSQASLFGSRCTAVTAPGFKESSLCVASLVVSICNTYSLRLLYSLCRR